MARRNTLRDHARGDRGNRRVRPPEPGVTQQAAERVVDHLLTDDALTPAQYQHDMSPARRLFDRLVMLCLVRELSGRASFRSCGL